MEQINYNSVFRNPKNILFLFQILIIFIVITSSLINLTYQWGSQKLWLILLTGTLGYLMPNPKIYLDNFR
jgi:hypothetical protein